MHTLLQAVGLHVTGGFVTGGSVAGGSVTFGSVLSEFVTAVVTEIEERPYDFSVLHNEIEGICGFGFDIPDSNFSIAFVFLIRWSRHSLSQRHLS